MKRADVFARDAYRCVYCGEVFPAESLSLDHVQPRVRGGNHSAGNVVTACEGCNVRKGHRRLAEFLAEEPDARAHFFRLATHVWPRHLRAVEEEVQARLDRGRRRSAG